MNSAVLLRTHARATLPQPGWWDLWCHAFRIPPTTGKRFWQALANASKRDAEMLAFTFLLHGLPNDQRFLDELRRVFRTHDARFWCELIERLVTDNLLDRKNGSIVEEAILQLVDPIGQWR